MLRAPFQSLGILLLAWLAVAGSAQAASLTLADIGMINVKSEGAYGDNSHDDTNAINAAIQKARSQKKALLFPSGTYLVSDVVRAEIKGTTTENKKTGKIVLNCDTDINPVALVGSTAGAKPVIKLKNSSTGYGSSSEAGSKPIVRFKTYADENGNGRYDDGELDTTSNFFRCGIRNIKIENGSGNPGAVGLDFAGSQGCVIENMEMDLSAGGFAGMTSLIGQQGCFSNVKITGGQYGIYCEEAKYPAIQGLELINQTVAAIRLKKTWRVTQISGFSITKISPPAIVLDHNTGAYNHLSLFDGKIEFTAVTDDVAIDNTGDQIAALNNVYIKNADVIKSGSRSSVAGNSGLTGWVKVNEYSSPSTFKNVVNGATNTLEYATVSRNFAAGSVPTDLLSRHAPNPADWPSPDVIMNNANDDVPGYAVLSTSYKYGDAVYVDPTALGQDGRPDATAELQRLVNNNRHVLIPAGKYILSNSVKLPGNVTLQGTWINITALVCYNYAIENAAAYKSKYNLDVFPATSAGYNRDANNDGFIDGDTAMIRTVNGATSSTKMGCLTLRYYTNTLSKSWIMALAWFAGEESTVKNVWVRPQLTKEQSGGNDRSQTAFLGPNVGGRHYGIGAGGREYLENPAQRRILIDKGTGNNSALCLYNVNPEHGYTGQALIRIKDSQNVGIFGAKMEDSYLVEWLNCDNCALLGSNGLLGKSGDSSGSNDSENIYVAVGRSLGSAVIDEWYNNVHFKPSLGEALGVFKRGVCDFSKFHIDASGQSNCTLWDGSQL